MSHVFAASIFFLIAGGLFVLPALPALLEWRLKRDAHPLNVIQQYAGDIRHFARGFHESVQSLTKPLQDCVGSGDVLTATLPGGDSCLLLGNSDLSSLIAGRDRDMVCPYVVIGGVNLLLPNGLTFLKEIYSLEQFSGGEGNIYRAILGEKNVHVVGGSKIMRWAHAVGKFQADRNCSLYGRISSEREIVLNSGCIFQRLNAPRIFSGGDHPQVAHVSSASFDAPHEKSSSSQILIRKLLDEDVEISPGETLRENLVTRGRMRIGAGSRVLGSVKSNREMVIEEGVSIGGSLISAGRMDIGPGCRVHGPVIAERDLAIAAGTSCGEADTPTTVSALTIRVEEGVTVFGTLWARDIGRVVSS
ncbi:MAG TPA: hypothetical protein VGT03_11975 [Candidatus Acidoferrales bacterium]|nr:hypothetical protein [Candidatus Acidoferrales bacterium]